MPTFPATDSNAYKTLARAWGATVNVVTAKHAQNGTQDGFTATAFLTVSIDPPIVLVSVTNASSAAETLKNSAGFVVNLLAPNHMELSNGFAKKLEERQALLGSLALDYDAAGVAILPGVAGAFSATVRELVEAGDHTLVLGDVTAIHHGGVANEDFATLLYQNRAYGEFKGF